VEIYATDFGWSGISPLEKELDVYESLDLFLGRYGIPESLLSDNAKACIHGDYKKKAKQAGVSASYLIHTVLGITEQKEN
jgi:hypothetical protein